MLSDDKTLAVASVPREAPRRSSEARVREVGRALRAPQPAQPRPAARSVRRVRAWLGPYLLGGASLLGGLALWHVAATTRASFVLSFENVPAPSVVFGELWAVAQTSLFYVHVGVSMQRILTSYALAALLGIPLGVAMGRSRWVHHLVAPHLEIMRPIPAVAWIPLAILMWPSEEGSILFITFLGAFFPIVLNTIHGVEQTPEVLVRAGRCMGANARAIFWHVVIPSALPAITTGLAIGMGVAWFSLLAGEIISGQYGIGYFTWDAYSLVKYPQIIIGMLAIGTLGLLSTAAVRLGTRPFLRWQPKGA